MTQLDNFEEAFHSHLCGCVRTCACERVFYHNCKDYDWEEGELEELNNSCEAYALPYPVETFYFDGKEYCYDCECWKGRINNFIQFVDKHLHQIVEYINLEKERKQKIADNHPIISNEKELCS